MQSMHRLLLQQETGIKGIFSDFKGGGVMRERRLRGSRRAMREGNGGGSKCIMFTHMNLSMNKHQLSFKRKTAFHTNKSLTRKCPILSRKLSGQIQKPLIKRL